MITQRQSYDLGRWARSIVQDVRAELHGLIRRCVVGRSTSEEGDTARSTGTTFGEVSTEAEQLQQYGFASLPPSGAEGVYLKKLGVMICCDHRENRPTLAGQEVSVWHDSGSKIILRDDGSIVLLPKDGMKVELGAEPGAEFVALATKIDTELSILKAAIDGAAVVANDGGAAFKGNIIGALGSWPGSVAAQNVRAT